MLNFTKWVVLHVIELQGTLSLLVLATLACCWTSQDTQRRHKDEHRGWRQTVATARRVELLHFHALSGFCCHRRTSRSFCEAAFARRVWMTKFRVDVSTGPVIARYQFHWTRLSPISEKERGNLTSLLRQRCVWIGSLGHFVTFWDISWHCETFWDN